ncbi:MAG TPA: glycosyltransferase family 4 protein [Azospirillum sp.]|nr:glycosyltransferase family 4 protein [Azospirillum sp.]
MPEQPSILFINRVFPPSHGATGRVLADLAEHAAAAGWRVTVLADGAGEAIDWRGVRVVRTGTGGDRPWARGYLAALARLVVRGLTLPRHDVVVTMTDPPFLALVGPLLAARHGAALHWCHDLYPALLPVLGLRLPAPLAGWLEAAVGWALRRHGRVVAIGRCMAERLAGMGVARERLSVVPNWADPGIRPAPRDGNPLRRELGLGERFTVAYAGNMGLAHPMDGVLEAAASLPEVDFLLVGEGRGRQAVARTVRERGLANVRLLPFQPAGRLNETLAAADLHLASMAVEAEGMLVPCKVAGTLAAGRPCLFLGPGGSEAARCLTEHGCGAVLDPRDGAGLAAAIRGYAADPQRCAAEGARALAASALWSADVAGERFLAAAAALRRPAPHTVYAAPVPGRSHG